MNFAGHPAARVRAQYSPGADLRPALVHENVMAKNPLCVHKTCFGLQIYTIKTNLQAKSITCRVKKSNPLTGVPKIGHQCNKSGYLSLKTPHFG